MKITSKGFGLLIMAAITGFVWYMLLTTVNLQNESWMWTDYFYSWTSGVSVIIWGIYSMIFLDGGMKFELDFHSPITRLYTWFSSMFKWQYADRQEALIDSMSKAKNTDELNLIIQKLEILEETKPKWIPNKYTWRLPDNKLELKNPEEVKEKLKELVDGQ